MCEHVYSLLYHKGKIYVSKGKEGYELVGGEVKKGEGYHDAMLRIISSKTGISGKDISFLRKTNHLYGFDSDRCKHGHGTETHYLYVAKSKVAPAPKGAGTKLVGVTEPELLGSMADSRRRESVRRLLEDVVETDIIAHEVKNAPKYK